MYELFESRLRRIRNEHVIRFLVRAALFRGCGELEKNEFGEPIFVVDRHLGTAGYLVNRRADHR